jgi:hypothetical protein
VSNIWHDFKNPTECCGRPPWELPIGDGRTSDGKRVTCDGNQEAAVMAHEVYAHPSEYADEPPTLDHAVRYHIARALAMYPCEGDLDNPEWFDRIATHLNERQIACLYAALAKGLSGQEAVDYAHAYSSGDSSELLYDLAVEFGVELDRIRPYAMRHQAPVAAESEMA